MIRQHLKTALRNVTTQKGYSLINIAGLTVGMAFTILILLWVQYEASFDRFHTNLDRLYQVAFTVEARDFHGAQTVGALAPFLQDNFPVITHATRLTDAYGIEFERDGEKYVAIGRFVDPSFLEMFTFPVTHGDPREAFSSPTSIIITKGMARRIYGDEDAVGKTLLVSEEVPLTVTAVLENPPKNTELDFEFLLSCAINSPAFDKWDVKSLATYVMLSPGNDAASFSDKISEVYNDHNPGQFPNYLYLRPVRDMHLYELNGGGLITYITVFSILAAAILFIACINFTNLSTARAATRSKEIGVKKVSGATRSQLVTQFLTESLVVSFIALVLAVALTELLLPTVNAIAGSEVDLVFSPLNVACLLAMAVFTGLVAGVYPALVLASFQPARVFKGQAVSAGISSGKLGRLLGGLSGGSLLRRLLVVSQFAVSIALIIGVLVIYGQLNYVRTMDMGFEKDQVVLFYLPPELVPRTAAVKTELLRHDDIESVCVSSNSLVRWQTSFGIGWEGKNPENVFDVGHNRVDYDYLETFQMEMAEGRFFSRDFPSDVSEAYVVNEACVRAMGVTDPVGRSVTLAPGSSLEAKGTIVGVIKDYHTESAHKEIRPFILGLAERGSYMCVRIKPGSATAAMTDIRGEIGRMAPDAEISLRFFDSALSGLYRAEELTATVVIYITIVAVFISCLGLFGLAAYSAHRRTKEIGVRKVMGASASSLVRLLCVEFLLLIVVACLIACPIAFVVMNRWLETFAFRVGLGLDLFLMACGLTLVIALATVSFQAIRAASSNPIDTLRYE